MPSRAEHEARAQANERIAAQFRLSDPDEVAWAVTILFYAALHYVEVYFDETAGVHHLSHADRFFSTDMLPIGHEFRLLYDASRCARYEMNLFTLPEVTTLMGYYAAVKTFVTRALSPPSP
jgi:hypothetical protein